MSGQDLVVGPADGSLTVHTGVAGPASKAGHRLTIGFESWSGTVGFDDDGPTRVRLAIEVDSLSVLGGEGGVTPLSGPEKVVARSNALKTLQVKRFPTIVFEGARIVPVDGGYRVSGEVTICGRGVEHAVDVLTVDVAGGWDVSARTVVRHSDVGLKPFSLMMGTLRVADEVDVEFSARLAAGTGQ